MEPMQEGEPVPAACQGGKQRLFKMTPSYHGVTPMMGLYFWMVCSLTTPGHCQKCHPRPGGPRQLGGACEVQTNSGKRGRGWNIKAKRKNPR